MVSFQKCYNVLVLMQILSPEIAKDVYVEGVGPVDLDKVMKICLFLSLQCS